MFNFVLAIYFNLTILYDCITWKSPRLQHYLKMIMMQWRFVDALLEVDNGLLLKVVWWCASIWSCSMLCHWLKLLDVGKCSLLEDVTASRHHKDAHECGKVCCHWHAHKDAWSCAKLCCHQLIYLKIRLTTKHSCLCILKFLLKFY